MIGKRLMLKHAAILAGTTVLAFVLYLIGVRFFLLPVLIGIGMWWLPMPRVINSWFSRAIISFLLTMTLLQLAASLAFLVFPRRGFVLLACILVLVHVCMWLCAPKRSPGRISFISANDICGLLVVVCFLLPFAKILMDHSTVHRIAEIGSVQAIDATNHYAAITELTRAQHLNYAKDYYTYPKGFHIAVGFAQNTFFANQYELGWQGNAILYFADYLFYGALLGFTIYLLASSWLTTLAEHLIPTVGWVWPKFLIALCIAPSLTLLYLLPLISEGFLAYYYVCITLVAALLFLGELGPAAKTKDASLDLHIDHEGRWWLIAYLLLVFGAVATWPLLLPPFAVGGALFLLPSHLHWKTFMRRVVHVEAVPVIIAYLILLIPIYFQLKYGTGTAQNLNLTGGLTQFHPLVLLAGFIIVVGILLNEKVDEGFRRTLTNIFIPLFGFLAILMLFQYFTVGEVRYYIIKVSLLMEMLLLALGSAVLVRAFMTTKLFEVRTAWLLPVVPLLAMMLLISTVANPLKDTRDLFRHASQDVIPQYLDKDVVANVKLGEAGKIKHFNMTELHYNSEQGKFFADMQVPYWTDMMQYSGSARDREAQTCIGDIYSNLAFGNYDANAQQLLTIQLNRCIQIAMKHGETFYVVTDPDSYSHVRQLLGNQVTIVKD